MKKEKHGKYELSKIEWSLLIIWYYNDTNQTLGDNPLLEEIAEFADEKLGVQV